jgi:hypothetical protein
MLATASPIKRIHYECITVLTTPRFSRRKHVFAARSLFTGQTPLCIRSGFIRSRLTPGGGISNGGEDYAGRADNDGDGDQVEDHREDGVVLLHGSGRARGELVCFGRLRRPGGACAEQQHRAENPCVNHCVHDCVSMIPGLD